MNWIALATVCGLPATAVPIGLTNAGLPVGVQVIGPHGGDALTLAVAQAIEEEIGGFRIPPLREDPIDGREGFPLPPVLRGMERVRPGGVKGRGMAAARAVVIPWRSRPQAVAETMGSMSEWWMTGMRPPIRPRGSRLRLRFAAAAHLTMRAAEAGAA